MIAMPASQQSFALLPVCVSPAAASAILFPLSVAGLSAANSLTPASPRSDRRGLKHAKRESLQPAKVQGLRLLPLVLEPESFLTQTPFGCVVASNLVAHCSQVATCPECSLILTDRNKV